jgi:putative ABC transport system substrate-binding protein
VLPTATIAVLLNPTNPNIVTQLNIIQQTALEFDQHVEIVYAGAVADFDTAFATIASMEAGAMLVGVDSFFNSQRAQIVTRVASLAVPAMYEHRDFTVSGGLMSYGASLSESYRQGADYVARILNGESPAELPVVSPSEFEFVINLRTANTLGLVIPPMLLARATEFIE